MRPRKNKILYRTLWGVFFLAALGRASETRVDSAGGLSLVLSDESNELKPFIFGNPAGLSFLESPNRFDLAGFWLSQSSAASNLTNSFYGTVTDPLSTSLDYHGLILEPSKDWTIQLDGDLLHTETQPDFGALDQSRDRSRELFRTSIKIGALALGGQVQATQASLALKPGYFGAVQLDSGQGTGSGLLGTGGLLLSFPANPLAQQSRVIAGGIYSRALIPGRSKTDMVLEEAGPITVNLSQSLQEGDSQSFGPEIYFESPNSLQAVLLGRISNGDISLQQESSNDPLFNQPSHKYQSTSSTAVLGALKTNSPLQRLMSLKSGASFLFQTTTTSLFDPSQNPAAVSDSQTWQFQMGTGLEGLEKYTVGLQARLQGVSGGFTPAGASAEPVNFFSYQLSLGGEQWISNQWAFRAGIIYENDINAGASSYPSGIFTVPSGQRVVSTAITAGAGYKNSSFKADLGFFFDQPYVYDSPNPDDFMTQIGIQLSLSLLLE